jgi:predicted ester cyclase
MVMSPEDTRAFYRRYLVCCNDRRFDDLHHFVREDVHINGSPATLDEYVRGLESMIAPFPSYHWNPREILVDGDRLAVRFNDTGILASDAQTGAPASIPIDTEEFAFYRLHEGRIAEVWGLWCLAGTSLLTQLGDS